MNDEDIIKYIKVEMSIEEKKQFLQWVESSSENKECYRQIRKIWDLSFLDGKFDASNNEKAYQEVKNRIDFSPSEKSKSFNWVTGLLKIAAVAIITLSISLPLFHLLQKDSPVTYSSIDVPLGQRVQLTLPDSTVVCLNSGTRFTYPSNFSKKDRSVFLDGEARFSVSHNEKCPFIVKTASYSVKVLGTKFNVYAYEEGDRFEATLLEGSVILGKQEAMNEIRMKPGQQVVYDRTTNKMTLHNNVNIDFLYDWTNGYHNFNKIPFIEMLDRLSNYYDYKITITNPVMAAYECTGKFKYNEDIEYILNVVKISKPFKYKIKNKEIIIY